MPDPIAFNLKGAQLPDNTIDFYTLLDEPSSASTEELRSKISAIYSEAQANRDHRNLNKRNEYKTLLELLPPARAALLEAPKRAKYDEFLAQAKNGAAPSDFETFINDLMGFNEPMEEKTGLLGVQDKPAEPRVSVIKTPISPPSKAAPQPRPAPPNWPATPSTSSSGPHISPATRPSASQGAGGGSMAPIGAIAGFVIGALLGFLLLHKPLPAILIGVVLAGIGFVVLNSLPSNKVKM